jgi:RNA polymerase sigma-70 factor (ECF subfamily)
LVDPPEGGRVPPAGTDSDVDFDSTFDQNYPSLVRYCQRLVGDVDAAEDIAQESMVRLFHHQITGSDVGVRAWLFKTATHLVRDRYRVGQNRLRLLAEHPVRPSEPESPDTSLERQETRRRAREALDALSPRDQEILLMRHSGFSYKEIASAIDVEPTSIGTLLARAERRFAEAFSPAAEVL